MSPGQRKKILFVITKSVWGGAQKYVYDLATNVPKDRYEPMVALAGNGPLAQKLVSADIPIYRIKNFQRSVNPFKDLFALIELARLIWRLQPTIVHANSSKAGGLASLAARLYRIFGRTSIRVIFTAHGWAFHESRPWWQLTLIKLSSKLTALLADRVITVSDYDRSAAIYLGIAPEHKLITIHNGLRDTAFLDRAAAQKELIGRPALLLLGTVAEWTRNKGLSFLVAAFPAILTEHPQALLCLVGWGEEEERLRSQARELGLEQKIIFVKDKKEAPVYLKAFDVFVLPSIKEGLPYTILEAGAARLPVVATRVGGIPEIIQDGQNGLLASPASSKELGRAILHVLKNQNEKEQFAASLQKTIETKFQFQNFVQHTMKVYES